MTISFRSYGGELSPSLVAEFETKYSVSIPKQYVEFLGKNGVCSTTPYRFVAKYQYNGSGEGENRRELGVFFGFHEDNEFTLKWNYEIYVAAGRVSPSMIPIASEGTGDVICMGCTTENYGKIYFYNHEGEAHNSILLSDNLDQFLSSLIK